MGAEMSVMGMCLAASIVLLALIVRPTNDRRRASANESDAPVLFPWGDTGGADCADGASADAGCSDGGGGD